MRSLTISAVALLLILITAVWLIRTPAPGGHNPSIAAESGLEPQLCDAWAGKPVMNFEQAKGLLSGRINNAPKVGEPAPPFTLVDSLTGKAISLQELYREKPVVLYFASYSCHIVHNSATDLARIANRFKNLVNFVVVYIREAHPEGGYPPTPGGLRFVVPAPFDFASRVNAARRLAANESFNFPVLVDSMDDTVTARWGAWPVRLFVIARNGKVVFAGQQGPWFFKPTEGFDPDVPQVPEGLRDLAGYSKESLEEILQNSIAPQPRT